MNTPNFNRVQTLEPPPYLRDLPSSGQHYTLNTEAKQMASDKTESKPIVEIRFSMTVYGHNQGMKMDVC